MLKIQPDPERSFALIVSKKGVLLTECKTGRPGNVERSLEAEHVGQGFDQHGQVPAHVVHQEEEDADAHGAHARRNNLVREELRINLTFPRFLWQFHGPGSSKYKVIEIAYY